jgi:hypothetical protein
MAILADVAPYSREYQVSPACLTQKPLARAPETGAAAATHQLAHWSAHQPAHLSESLSISLPVSLLVRLLVRLFYTPNPVMIMDTFPVLEPAVNYPCFGPMSTVSVFLSKGRDIPRVPNLTWGF